MPSTWDPIEPRVLKQLQQQLGTVWGVRRKKVLSCELMILTFFPVQASREPNKDIVQDSCI
jgi:hypothetical protein